MNHMQAVVRGRVQGVGFRDAAAREARRLGLRGWIRNRMDGAVEVSADGSPAALRALETFLRRGPPMANVTGTDIFWESPPSSSGEARGPASDGTRPDGANRFEIR